MTERTPHVFNRDPEVPPDHLGRSFCRCGVVDIPGDPRHHLPEVPEQADHERRYGDDTHGKGAA